MAAYLLRRLLYSNLVLWYWSNSLLNADICYIFNVDANVLKFAAEIVSAGST